MGRVLRATNKNHTIRMFTIDSTDMVEKARQIHNTTPVASACLGRMISASSMMGLMLKGDNEKLTLQIKGNGELGGIVAVTNSKGVTKAYPLNPDVKLRVRESDGKLDVSGAIGKGKLTVIKDFGLKEPYIGQTNLVTGEIAEDITAYFAYSEQQPSAVALGVLVDVDWSIKSAGGFIVQLMPEVSEEDISKLEQNLSKIKSVSDLICEENNLENIINCVLEGMNPEILDEIDVKFECDCSKEKLTRALISIGKDELVDILEKDKSTELTCHFCNTHYKFDENDLKEIIGSLN